MTEYKIYSADGKTVKATVHELEYSGQAMGECSLTVTVKSPVPIAWAFGDYIDYRSERFTMNYDPTVKKISSRGTYLEGFTYDSIKFNAPSDELTRADFLDVVLADNNIHYTSLPSFSFYCESVKDLCDRIQANLDRYFTGEHKWTIRILKKDGTYYTVNKKGENCSKDDFDGKKDIPLSADNIMCWDALEMVNSSFFLNYHINGHTITVGEDGENNHGLFRYGKGNGLKSIERVADSSQRVITRMHAYGSDKNLPLRYYANLGSQVFGNITDIWLSDKGLAFYLDTAGSLLKEYKAGDDTGHQVTLYIYVNDVKYQLSLYAFTMDQNPSHDSNLFTGMMIGYLQSSADNYDKWSALKIGDRIYFADGVDKDNFESVNRDYLDDVPNNMAIRFLMLPGFPKQSLADWVKTEDTKKWAKECGIDLSKYEFSSDKLDPWVQSKNADVIGILPATVQFNTDNEKDGIIDIYPSIEEMTAADAYTGGSADSRVDEVAGADQIADDGVFDGREKAGTKIDPFEITLPYLGFDIADYIDIAHDSPQISMKDGKCGGRSFNILNVTTNDDKTTTLKVDRVKDDALNLYFPYKDYNIEKGDHYVLINIKLPDNYVNAAAKKLLRYTLAYLSKNDYTRYTYTPEIDNIWMKRQDMAAKASGGNVASMHDIIKEGDTFHFMDTDLNMDVDIPIDTLTIKEGSSMIPEYEITLKDLKEPGTLQRVQNQVQSISDTLAGHSYGGGGGYDAIGIQRMVRNFGKDYFLSKINDDSASGEIQFSKGLTAGTFVTGATGAGIFSDRYGNWHMEADYLDIRKKLTAKEVEIMRVSHAGGEIVVSPGEAVITSVTEQKGDYYCTCTLKDGNGNEVEPTIAEGDLVYCQTFNLTKNANGMTESHFYWRHVSEVTPMGDECVILLSGDDGEYAENSDAPLVGDHIVTLGNRSNKERQAAITIGSYGAQSPFLRQYSGINTFKLPTPDVQISPVDGTDNGGTWIKVYNSKFDEMSAIVKGIKDQNDQQMVLWFGDGAPASDKEPEKDWTDYPTKHNHVGDIYYNRTAQGKEPVAYSWVESDSKTFTWSVLTDKDVLQALEDAARAQDTADGKRRVFVSEPKPPYDVGDMWVNATGTWSKGTATDSGSADGGEQSSGGASTKAPSTATEDTVTYNNDILRCINAKGGSSTDNTGFSINDWTPAQQYTTSGIEQKASNITAWVQNGLSSAGITISADGKTGSINLNADTTTVSDDLVVSRLLTKPADGKNAHIEASEGVLNIYGDSSTPNIVFGVKDGCAVLSYYDKDGKWLYDLGPDGMVKNDLKEERFDKTEFIPYSLTDHADNGSVTPLYRYQAKRINGDVYGSDLTGGSNALAAECDGRWFTNPNTIVSNGAVVNKADGITCRVQNPPIVEITSASKYDNDKDTLIQALVDDYGVDENQANSLDIAIDTTTGALAKSIKICNYNVFTDGVIGQYTDAWT